MKLQIVNLHEKHLPLVDVFSCLESNETLSKMNAKNRRRVIKHSKELDEFLKHEALNEQRKGLNSTHLFIDTEQNRIVGYVSLCTDGIRLEYSEQKSLNMRYCIVPAIKIARLAVSNKYQNLGIGSKLIDFSVFIANEINKQAGVTFLTLDCYEHRVSYYQSKGFKRNMIQLTKLSYDSPISMRLSLANYLHHIAKQ